MQDLKVREQQRQIVSAADRTTHVGPDELRLVRLSIEIEIDHAAGLDIDAVVLVAGNLDAIEHVVARASTREVGVELRAHFVASRPEPRRSEISGLNACD